MLIIQSCRHEEKTASVNKPSEYSDASRSSAGQMSLSELTDHIVATHHVFARAALPRLSALLDAAMNAHAATHPELFELAGIFLDFQSDLLTHMSHEEKTLHPRIRSLDTNCIECDSLADLIEYMEADHDGADQALTRLRTMTHDFTPPAGASSTYRALLQGLRELDADLQKHFAAENELLFPRAIQTDESLRTNLLH